MDKIYCGRDDFHNYIVDLTEHYIDLGKESNYLRFANCVHPDAIKQWVESLYNHNHYENYWIFYELPPPKEGWLPASTIANGKN